MMYITVDTCLYCTRGCWTTTVWRGRRFKLARRTRTATCQSLHRHFKTAGDQALMLRGSRDFESRDVYTAFLGEVLDQKNAGRRVRLQEELAVLRGLPASRRESYRRISVRVGSGSLIRVDRNTYSVDSRLIGERVEVRICTEHLEIWFGQKLIERLPRLRGRGKHHINYRHIIDTLVRKPGAFENYRYREELLPTSRFRMAYDMLRSTAPATASRQYLEILYLAARHSESAVDDALRVLLDREAVLSLAAVREFVHGEQQAPPLTDVTVALRAGRAVGGQARLEAEPGAQAAVEARRYLYSRHWLRAAEPRGDGSVVRAVGRRTPV